jgi:hypothetical protein
MSEGCFCVAQSSFALGTQVFMVSCRSGNTSGFCFFYPVRSDSMGLLLVFLAMAVNESEEA